MKLLPLVALAVFGFASSSFGFVTLQISNPYNVGIASGFAAQNNTPRNNMTYGIIVSTDGTATFSSGAYDAMSSSVFVNGGFLSVNGVLTDDYYFPSISKTYDSSGDVEDFDDNIPGGPGTIELVSNVPIGSDLTGLPPAASPISSGDRFALIWFSTDTAAVGDYYGFFTDNSFVMPASGTVDFSSIFVGADSPRAANLQFLAGVPEPSHSILALLGVSALAFRRRRNN